ncbi:MAG: hypothetical protein ACFCUM_13645 [Bacteroidales bacterium]
MKRFMHKIKMLIILSLIMLTGGCGLLEGVFEAGFWAGLIGVLVVLLIIFGIIKLFQTMWKK